MATEECEICGFYHHELDVCREAESYVQGEGFIAYRNGLYIKPLNPLSSEDDKKREVFSKRNSIKNRLYRLRDRTASANDQISYDLVDAIINGFSKRKGGLTELQIMSLNSINEMYPGK